MKEPFPQAVKNHNARIQHGNPAYFGGDRKMPPLDPVEILDIRARSCSRAEDCAFWILTSAAAHLNGYDLNDGEPSTVETYLHDYEVAK